MKANNTDGRVVKPKAKEVTISKAEVLEIASMLKAANVSEERVAEILYVVKAQEVRAAIIDTVIELTNAIVKQKYEANTNTNAFTDALLAKLNAIEANATADQTGAEIVALIDAALSGTGWQSGGAGGAVDSVNGATGTVTLDTDDIAEGANKYYPAADRTKLLGIEANAQQNDTGAEIVTKINTALGGSGWQSSGGGASKVAIDETANNLTITGKAVGTAPVLTSSAAGTYVLSNADNVEYLNLDGANNALNGSSELELTLVGTTRRFNRATISKSNGVAQDEFALSIGYTFSVSGSDIVLTISGLAGFGTGGFIVVLS